MGTAEEKPQQDPQTAAQLEKLRLEIADLKWKVRWVYKMAQVISILSACIAVAALIFGLYQFNYQQKQESKKPVRERQLSLVFEVSDVTATIAALKPDDEARKKAENRFRTLYWGPIVLAEDQDLLQRMVDFANCLEEGSREYVGCASDEEQDTRLKELSLELAIERRKLVGEAWDVKYDDIYKKRTQGTPSPSALP